MPSAIQEAARTHGLTMGEIEDWKDKFLLGAENALRSRPRDEEALKDEQIRRLKQKVGELVLDAEWALENACIKRFGTLRPNKAMPVIRSDNGLVFQSRRFRETCRDYYKLMQEAWKLLQSTIPRVGPYY